jgi:hypothetical protein
LAEGTTWARIEEAPAIEKVKKTRSNRFMKSLSIKMYSIESQRHRFERGTDARKNKRARQANPGNRMWPKSAQEAHAS